MDRDASENITVTAMIRSSVKFDVDESKRSRSDLQKIGQTKIRLRHRDSC